MPGGTISPRRRRPPPTPLQPKMTSGAEPAGSGGGILKCTCFHLPLRSKKKLSAPPPLATTKLIGGSVSRMSSAAEAPVAATTTTAQSPRVTFLASVSLSTWWPSSPPSSGPGPDASSIVRNVVGPRRSSTPSSAAPRNGLPRASSLSFSHWRRSLSSSRRVTPHGGASARASFSFPTSPASASSSCMSTPKIPHGCQQ